MVLNQKNMKKECKIETKKAWRRPVLGRIDIKRTMNFAGSLSDTGRPAGGSTIAP